MKPVMIVAVLSVLTACASMQMTSNPGEVERALPQMNRNFSDFVRRGDAVSVANMYADDAVFMAPNAQPARGREAIRQAWSGLLGSGHVDISLSTEKVIQSCDLAAEIGHYEFTLTPNAAGATPLHDTGKYVVNWRNINGQWRIVADIFNSNLPATAPR